MEYAWIFMQIILINIVLSGDNAVVIAMASKNLPPEQRRKAIWWGALGAVALRVLLTAVAVILLFVPYIQAVGSLLLLYIAIKLLLDDQDGVHIRQAHTLSAAVGTIIVADFIMSLDNVLAIAAIVDGNFPMLFAGIALSIPIVIWGSTLIVRLLQRFPLVIYLGAAILAYTAGEMFIQEQKVREWLGQAHPSYTWVVPLLFISIVVFSGWVRTRRKIET